MLINNSSQVDQCHLEYLLPSSDLSIVDYRSLPHPYYSWCTLIVFISQPTSWSIRPNLQHHFMGALHWLTHCPPLIPSWFSPKESVTKPESFLFIRPMRLQIKFNNLIDYQLGNFKMNHHQKLHVAYFDITTVQGCKTQWENKIQSVPLFRFNLALSTSRIFVVYLKTGN